MSRAAGLCKYCGGPRRGRAARVAAPWARCANEDCNAEICERHSVMDGPHWICKKCAREMKTGKSRKTEDPVMQYQEEVVAYDDPDAAVECALYLPRDADYCAHRD